jgi:RNA polymerase sigma-70 factor (family 1)
LRNFSYKQFFTRSCYFYRYAIVPEQALRTKLTMEEGLQLQLLQQKIANHADSAAFKQLYLRFFQPLKHFAYTITHSHEQAEEVVEDVFIQLWTNKENLLSVENLKVYLYVSVRNIGINYLKKENKHSHQSIDYADANLQSTYSNPEQLVISTELRKRIDSAIQNLPPKCKLIFKMAKEDKLPYKDIAAILNITVKTIDAQLAIALKKISLAINFDLDKKQRVGKIMQGDRIAS